MTNTNRKTGTSFERELCEELARYGFWAHNLAQNSAGQPFDVIAARDGKVYPIDAKVCEKDVFRLVRIEDNQFSAMTLWKDTGNGEGWFAKTVLSRSDILEVGVPLELWVMGH